MVSLRSLATALLAVGGLAAPNELVKRASLQRVTDFGENSSNTLMYIYVPNKLASNPAVIVAIHYCTGTAQAYYQGTPYAQLAEQYGFIVIYPQSPYSGTCWDVSSKAALTHNGGADSNSIANMVTWTLAQYKGDASRVFVTGSSSGAMMTNVMAATYPELFAAASVYSGVPAGCFYTGTVDGWNATCAEGHIDQTQAYWKNVVLNMYPGYSGNRPRMQIYHGTADTTLYPPNYNETIKEWTGVFGYSLTPQQVLAQTPSGPYTKYIFGPKLQGIYGQGIGHTVPVMGTEDMKWFGFIPGEPGESSTPTSAPVTTKTQPTSTPVVHTTTSAPSSGSTGCVAAHWAQCGGQGYTGCTTCVAGTTCQVSNQWYSQCL